MLKLSKRITRQPRHAVIHQTRKGEVYGFTFRGDQIVELLAEMDRLVADPQIGFDKRDLDAILTQLTAMGWI